MRLDLGKFKAWLSAKQPDEIVGETGSCLSCPIANFYSAVAGADLATFGAGDGGYVVDRGDGNRRPPRWANRFMQEVDGEYDANGERVPEITARRALEILAEI